MYSPSHIPLQNRGQFKANVVGRPLSQLFFLREWSSFPSTKSRQRYTDCFHHNSDRAQMALSKGESKNISVKRLFIEVQANF